MGGLPLRLSALKAVIGADVVPWLHYRDVQVVFVVSFKGALGSCFNCQMAAVITSPIMLTTPSYQEDMALDLSLSGRGGTPQIWRLEPKP